MALRNLIPWNRERSVDVTRRSDDPFWSLHREMNRLFEDFARGFDLAPAFGFEGFAPRVDVRETDDAILVEVEMPGLEEKDFELTLAQHTLTLRGEKRREREEKGAAYRYERSYGSFDRTIPLPCEVEADQAKATYRHGVLNVTLPKSESARRNVRRIEVTSR
jgi:HSP20 family protein